MPENTTIMIGTHPDGRPAHWHLSTTRNGRTRLVGGLITGNAGAGGTTLLTGIAHAAHEHRIAELRAVDAPMELAGCVHLAAPSYPHLLADLEERIEQRQADQAAGHVDARTLVLIDEADQVFTKASAPRWARIAARGPALGIALVVRVQRPTLRTFGASADLRDALETGNRVHLDRRGAHGVVLAPALLP